MLGIGIVEITILLVIIVVLAVFYGLPLIIGLFVGQWKLGLGLSLATFGVSLVGLLLFSTLVGSGIAGPLSGLVGLLFEGWAVWKVLQARQAVVSAAVSTTATPRDRDPMGPDPAVR